MESLGFQSIYLMNDMGNNSVTTENSGYLRIQTSKQNPSERGHAMLSELLRFG